MKDIDYITLLLGNIVNGKATERDGRLRVIGHLWEGGIEICFLMNRGLFWG